MKIKDIKAREILDSRGNPTLETICILDNGVSAKASVPSGASTGIHEALELRDNDPERYAGLGVLRAVENVNSKIRKEIIGKELDQKSLDDLLIRLDGTENKSRLGANAILSISLSFARASARMEGKELYEYIGKIFGNNRFKIPKLMLNFINGGKHADSGLDIQEFMAIPDMGTAKEDVRIGSDILRELKKNLMRNNYVVSVGDEGGFAPKLGNDERALEFLSEAIGNRKAKIGLDVAASVFYENGKYNGKTSSEMIRWYQAMVKKYSIILIEDGLSEDDWEGFAQMREAMQETLVIGDDLIVTNTQRIKEAIEKKAISGVIIKPNQIGTLSETLEAVKIAKEAGLVVIVSHRSGETTDDFIADLAVGVGADYLKSGSLTRGERTCKYNRLLEIEENML